MVGSSWVFLMGNFNLNLQEKEIIKAFVSRGARTEGGRSGETGRAGRKMLEPEGSEAAGLALRGPRPFHQFEAPEAPSPVDEERVFP